MEERSMEPVSGKKGKKKGVIIAIIIAAVVAAVTVFLYIRIRPVDMEILTQSDSAVEWLKPVIYLYPEQETDVEVLLSCTGDLVCTYPKYDGGWKVTALPDGTLTDKNGRIYNYLFWEGEFPTEDIKSGFCISGKETERFLEDSLATLGLTDKEADDFISFWLPKMENNPYNVISFDCGEYKQSVDLRTVPAARNMIRVFMRWCSADEPVEIESEELTKVDRNTLNGFTVVEWGGAEL